MTVTSMARPIGSQESAASYRSMVGDVPEVLELLADVCQAPMAALKVADGTQAHYAATWGIPATVDVPQSRSLCDMVSAAHDAILVGDASHDPRLADHPLVRGAAHVNFIAAAPLHRDGHIVGALCVFDNERRRLDDARTRRYLEGLARRVDPETALRELLQQPSSLDLGADDDRLARTIDTLLRAADHRREPLGTRAAVELATVAAAEVAALGPAGARVAINVGSQPVHVYADAGLLGTAIGHLLRNALGFSPADQPVTVSIDGRSQPTIEIHDHGPGLDRRELSRLGTPFFRGDEARRREAPGLGLGLVVTRRIVRAQGAELHLASSPGAGFTARIVFG